MEDAALEEILQHTDFVRRVALSLCADQHGADDLVQETWIRALSRSRPDTGLRAWLGGVVRNLAREDRRGTRRRLAREAAGARVEALPSTDSVVERMEAHRRVVSAVLALSAEAREVIVLRYFEGLPPRAIAERLGVPVETARTREKRARERLRARLVDDYGGEEKACFAALLDLARNGGAAPAAVAYAAVVPATPVVALAVTLLVAASGLAGWLVFQARVSRETPLALAPAPARESQPDVVEGDRVSVPAGSRADSSTPAAEDEGVFVVLDVDGTELEGLDGSFFVRVVDGAPHEARVVSVRGGRFPLDVFTPGMVQIERASTFVGKDFRPVLFENAQLPFEAGAPFVVRGHYLPDAMVRVVDAETGAELDGVRVQRKQAYPNQWHPDVTPGQVAVYVDGASSPVRLPRLRSIQPYWVGARGYSWRFLKVDHETGGERVVRLVRAGGLDVELLGHDPDLAVRLRVASGADSVVRAGASPDESGRAHFDGLPPGTYEVRAEIGGADGPPIRLDEARVDVVVGGVTTAVLESRSDVAPPTVRVAGEIVVPASRAEDPVTLRIKPAGRPALRAGDVKRIQRQAMRESPSRPRVLEWNAGELTPGRYVLVVSPFQHGVLLDVPPAPLLDVRIEVPEVHRVDVRVVDEGSGVVVADAIVRWSRSMPREAGTDAWWYGGLPRESDHVTFFAPAGPIFVAASGTAHSQRFLNVDVREGTNELTLELPRLVPLEVVLRNGDTVIPWIHGMSCTFRAVGSEEWSPCGTYGRGEMRAYLDGPGLYEIAVGAIEGFEQPQPMVVSVGEEDPPPVEVQLVRAGG